VITAVILASGIAGLKWCWAYMHIGQTCAGLGFCYLVTWLMGSRKFGKGGKSCSGVFCSRLQTL